MKKAEFIVKSGQTWLEWSARCIQRQDDYLHSVDQSGDNHFTNKSELVKMRDHKYSLSFYEPGAFGLVFVVDWSVCQGAWKLS